MNLTYVLVNLFVEPVKLAYLYKSVLSLSIYLKGKLNAYDVLNCM